MSNNLRVQIVVIMAMLMLAGTCAAETWVYSSSAGCTACGGGGQGLAPPACNSYGTTWEFPCEAGHTYRCSVSVSGTFADWDSCASCLGSCGPGGSGSRIYAVGIVSAAHVCRDNSGGSAYSYYETYFPSSSTQTIFVQYDIPWSQGRCCPCSGHGTIIISDSPTFTASGEAKCVGTTSLYVLDNGNYHFVTDTSDPSYSFPIFDGLSYRLVFDGIYHEFLCTGNEVYNYDGCLYVYGYTCGVDTIKLRDNNSQLIETVYQDSGYDIYEMQIIEGEEYTISFYDMGILLCHDQTFTSAGNHVLIDFDRCSWVWPPSPWGPPIIIYVYAGYDYNIVVFKDEHGNFIENSKLAIYDKTDKQYIQRWADASEGYTLLGARFDTDHDVQLMLRTFDGVFTLDTVYPANGTSLVGDEDIVTTNWTIPIKYNLKLYPTTPEGRPVFDVFCGLSEYTPLNPGAFWGMDLSDRGYVPITNCSGFAMCDILAEKDGYEDYMTAAVAWSSKSAMAKDYRYEITMVEK